MTTERRRYYRIADRALVKYRVLAEERIADERQLIHDAALSADNVALAVAGIDERLIEVLESIRSEHREVGEALELIHRKLLLLTGLGRFERADSDAGPHREHEPSAVTLSGGGMSLAAGMPLALSACLAIDLVLLPSCHTLRIVGRVVDCRKADGERFAIGIEFETMREGDRDVLVQHIARRQAAQRREALESGSCAA